MYQHRHYGFEPIPRYPNREQAIAIAPLQMVTFGGFTAKELAITGAVSFAITRLLGASLPGAIVMGVGNILWEAGSSNITPGWKRYILGLFRKPHE